VIFDVFHKSLAPVLMLGLLAAGCATMDAPEERADLDSACRSAVELRLAPRTFEILSAAAGRVVGYERQLTRLKSAENGDFGRFGAADDPRFVWAHEAECCLRLMQAAEEDPPADPEPLVKAAAKLLLVFEQHVGWARFAACRELPRGNADLEAALLTLRLATGWPDERIYGFDFSSLPEPGKEPRFVFPERSVKQCGADLVRVTTELLALGMRSPMPEKAVLVNAAERVRSARIALAGCYLRGALRELKKERSAASLAAWRIARARYELEKAFPGW